jgi:hypothetical protein
MHNDQQFALTAKARAFLASQRPTPGNAPWVRPQWTPPKFQIVPRRSAETLSPGSLMRPDRRASLASAGLAASARKERDNVE